MRGSREESAVCLALVAGYVNSAGLVLVGTFTSHVTGNIGKAGARIASGDFFSAGGTLLLVLSFFSGAFSASIITQSGIFRRWRSAHSLVGLIEAILVLGPMAFKNHPAVQGALMAGAMGMQNSLITQVSGARIRTTHMTGIVTDMGIELARWIHGGRSFDPSALKLLGTLLIAFVVGAVMGALSAGVFASRAVIFPGVALIAISAFTFFAEAREAAQ